MSHLSEFNHGRHKNELVLGLCQNVSPKLPAAGTVHLKRCVASFKYLFNHLVVQAFVSSVKSACPACNGITGMSHNCAPKLEDKFLKRKQFYHLLHSVDKRALQMLFRAVCKEYYGDGVTICSCILYYKSLTIWRRTMQNQFLHYATPRGLDKRLLKIIKDTIEAWQKNPADLSSLQMC